MNVDESLLLADDLVGIEGVNRGVFAAAIVLAAEVRRQHAEIERLNNLFALPEQDLRCGINLQLREIERLREWRNTVDEMLLMQHEVASDDPRESINRLINWNCSVALDPAVSSDAAALVTAERNRCAWIARNGCLVPPDGGSPTEDERLLCEEIERRIRAEAA